MRSAGLVAHAPRENIGKGDKNVEDKNVGDNALPLNGHAWSEAGHPEAKSARDSAPADAGVFYSAMAISASKSLINLAASS